MDPNPHSAKLRQDRLSRRWVNGEINIMKHLFSTPDSAEIGLFHSLLEAAGIEFEIRNEHLSPVMPGAPFYPEIWVLRDEQFDKARELLGAWRPAASPVDSTKH